MWHKLFKSKSAKLSSSSTLSNTSTSDQPGRFCQHLDCSNTSCTHNNCNENNNKSTSNKFTNALKRVTLKRAHSAGSNSNSKKLQKQNGTIGNNLDENVSVLEQVPGFHDYHEFSMSSAINVPTRDADDRHLTSFSTFRVGSAGKFKLFLRNE